MTREDHYFTPPSSPGLPNSSNRSNNPGAMDYKTFLEHVDCVVSIYSKVPLTAQTITKYEGPTDQLMESVLKGLEIMAQRRNFTEVQAKDINSHVGPSSGDTHSQMSVTKRCVFSGMVCVLEEHDKHAQYPELLALLAPSGSSVPDDTKPNISEGNNSITLEKFNYNSDVESPFIREVTHICKAVTDEDLSQKFMVPIQEPAMMEVNRPSQSASGVTEASHQEESSDLAAQDRGSSAVEELRLLKQQLKEVTLVCKAVTDGNLTQKIIVSVEGMAMMSLKDVVNTMVDKFSRLGSQVLILDVKGTSYELTGIINKMAANISKQVRSIAAIAKAIALGDLSKQIEVDAQGEFLNLKNTVNGMVTWLRVLAAEVTRVMMEVSSEGKLGGQANVPDVKGVWWELVQNVNQTCCSLMDQVHSVAIVTTCVTRGNFTQKFEIEAKGEMATIKTTVNNMVDQLRAFTSEMRGNINLILDHQAYAILKELGAICSKTTA
ncbi:hypothetical protein D9758_004333 [Tetrapyrgos nigripes]|uniref:HAMP domain-containing protein n=1 Tax=Tetrapyrgos nigripes TaxID=182062 RepID=A0A8H5LS46_9AGAR|nr:hypothetical protein D9758_004333 [Tetrapyrgos nigripes]